MAPEHRDTRNCCTGNLRPNSTRGCGDHRSGGTLGTCLHTSDRSRHSNTCGSREQGCSARSRRKHGASAVCESVTQSCGHRRKQNGSRSNGSEDCSNSCSSTSHTSRLVSHRSDSRRAVNTLHRRRFACRKEQASRCNRAATVGGHWHGARCRSGSGYVSRRIDEVASNSGDCARRPWEDDHHVRQVGHSFRPRGASSGRAVE